jgi:hypothetical protein
MPPSDAAKRILKIAANTNAAIFAIPTAPFAESWLGSTDLVSRKLNKWAGSNPLVPATSN